MWILSKEHLALKCACLTITIDPPNHPREWIEYMWRFTLCSSRPLCFFLAQADAAFKSPQHRPWKLGCKSTEHIRIIRAMLCKSRQWFFNHFWTSLLSGGPYFDAHLEQQRIKWVYLTLNTETSELQSWILIIFFPRHSARAAVATAVLSAFAHFQAELYT